MPDLSFESGPSTALVVLLRDVNVGGHRVFRPSQLARERRFVFGVYRRQMNAIGYLGQIDRLFGVSATTCNWNTITAVAEVLENG